MNIQLPPPDRVPFGLRAMKMVALADGDLDATEFALLAAAQKMFQVDVDVAELEPITPAELAAEIVDPQLRWQLSHGMIVMALADGEADPAEFAQVKAFADALEVESKSFETLHKLADGHFLRARLDVARHFWAREKIIAQAKREGIGWLVKSIAALVGAREDKPLADRYRALESYPDNTLGRKYAEFIRGNEFAFPGEKGSPPETIALHDMTHTLGEYDTDPEGELEVLGFHAGFRKREPFTFLFFGLMQFHMGIQLTPIAAGATKNFQPELMMKSLLRGSAMTIDLTDAWDPWTVMDHDVDELRARYNILPKV